MSKKSHSHKTPGVHDRWVKDVTQGNKPYLYELPQEAEEVAVLAGGVAFQSATFDYPQKRSDANLVDMARERINLLLKYGAPPPGQQLTNDLKGFLELFETCLVQVYHIVMETYTEDPSEPLAVRQIFSKLGPNEIMAYCQATARENIVESVSLKTHD